MKRYIYQDQPLTGEEARKIHAKRISCAKETLSDLRTQVSEAEAELSEALGSPLPTHKRVQIVLEPGDAGYDEAPVSFSPENYQGDFSWTTTNTQPLPL
jgi:hypothetical protein